VSSHAFLFDLDGTLADTIGDITTSLNAALARSGLPGHDREACRGMIGAGASQLVARALPAGAEDRHPAVLDAFREIYAGRLADTSRPFPGIEALLAALTGRGLPVAVLSNKPHAATGALVSRLFPGIRFAAVLGQREGVPAKPDPAAALEIASGIGVAPARCAFVGDSAIDVHCARAAGMRAIGVLWGYCAAEALRAAGPDALIDQPAALLAAAPGGAGVA
jgi:phosphoglycolate phosphatase